jgi:outer membrane protein
MNKKLSLTTLSAALLALAIAPITASATEQGDWLVRGRIINVSPNDSSGTVGGIPGTSVTVDDDITAEVDFTYMVAKNWGLELILASSKHDVSGAGALAGLGLDQKILDVRTLPPTLTAQYHFAPDSNIRPYAGLGLNYTLFFNESATGNAESILGKTDVSLDSSFGLAGQLGVDIDVSDSWFLNFDVKYIDMNTTATLKTAGLGDLAVDVDINPWIFGIGIGTSF